MDRPVHPGEASPVRVRGIRTPPETNRAQLQRPSLFYFRGRTPPGPGTRPHWKDSGEFSAERARAVPDSPIDAPGQTKHTNGPSYGPNVRCFDPRKVVVLSGARSNHGCTVVWRFVRFPPESLSILRNRSCARGLNQWSGRTLPARQKRVKSTVKPGNHQEITPNPPG